MLILGRGGVRKGREEGTVEVVEVVVGVVATHEPVCINIKPLGSE